MAKGMWGGRLSLDSQDGDSGLDSGTERFPSVSEISLNRNSVLSDPGLDSPRTSPVITSKMFQHHRRQGSDTPFLPVAEQGLERTPRPLIIGPEEDYDPGYFNNECDTLFQDLGKLKSRPAHLGVFLRYIFSQADPSPLLFYLCAEVCQQMNSKDSRALGKEIWNIFLEKTAPLRIKVSEQLLAEIESRLRNGEDVRSAFSEAQGAAMPEIPEPDPGADPGLQSSSTKKDKDAMEDKKRNPILKYIGKPKSSSQSKPHLPALAPNTGPPCLSFLPCKFNAAAALACVALGVNLPPLQRPFPQLSPCVSQQSSSTKKDKDAMEDKKRNPILKYIGKPKSSSQSTFHVPLSPVEVKPGNVRNIIQHFENNQHCESQEPGTQRLSTGSFPEELLDSDSSSGEPGTQRLSTGSFPEELLDSDRSIESPNLGFGTDSFLPHLLEDDLGQLSDLEPEPDSQNWQHTVGRDVMAYLSHREIDRQEVINELFATEASHLRILRVLDVLFYQRLKRESLLSREELGLLFPNLPDLIDIHNSLSESMKKLREEGPIIKEIGDLMLSRFDGPAREEIQQVAAGFCSYQSIALELIKTKQRKETRFQIFMQEAESNPQCRRLQLKDLIISEMQRLTKYPLLLENILKHTDGGTPEHEKLCRARDQCREILRYVNEAVKRAENRHRLEAYQKRLDATSLERTSNPLAAEFKNLDLTSRRMIHEGALSWRIGKEKTLDLHVLLLEDLLVLLQKQDEKLVLKFHSKTALGSSDTKQTFSPVLKLNSMLIRSVATADENPTDFLGKGKHPVLPEEPEAEGSEEEEDGEAAPASPVPAQSSAELDEAGASEGPGPSMHLSLPGLVLTEGLAESALEDAEVEGTKDATPLADSSQSETELHEGGAANVDGNYFYVSMPSGPAESSTEPPAPTPPASLAEQPPSPDQDSTPGPGSLDGAPPPAPSLVIQDVDMIFRTIEQLTLKLTRLKDVEMAHCELLRSLGRGSSAETTPVGVGLPRWRRAGGWNARPALPAIAAPPLPGEVAGTGSQRAR
ncbi:Rho guanine nucleotide exchange factor 11 [Chelonia mydas]|uniref:Rho guanine nucleotide exchange factor 11 n=1 Tax=Chelonia mydas TaxID=8469 RepID=M7B2Q1_CHEMY|nr:Rho guanine nucleotide exchange factor 11 [Chelonia mydas]